MNPRRLVGCLIFAGLLLSPGQRLDALCSGGNAQPVEVIQPSIYSGLWVLEPRIEGDTLCFRVRNRKVPRYVDIYVEGVRRSDGQVVDFGLVGHLSPTQHNALWTLEDVVLLGEGRWEEFIDEAYKLRHEIVDIEPARNEDPFVVENFSSYEEIRIRGYGLGLGDDHDLTSREFRRMLRPAVLTVAGEIFGKLKNQMKILQDWEVIPKSQPVSMSPVQKFFRKLAEYLADPKKAQQLATLHGKDSELFREKLFKDIMRQTVKMALEDPELYVAIATDLGFDQLGQVTERIKKSGWKKFMRTFEVVEIATDWIDMLTLSRARSVTTFRIASQVSKPYLFLVDTSASMKRGDRIGDAKRTAIGELQRLASSRQGSGSAPSVSVLAFSGHCSPTSITRTVVDFTHDYDSAVESISSRLPEPDGRTPLPQAIRIAEQKLKTYLDTHGGQEGRLIVLSDGESTCGSLRPDRVYGYSPKDGEPGDPRIRYNTVGFHLQPGSPAERDLQYLASRHDGRYYSAQSRRRLARAFEKVLETSVPKFNPGSEQLTPTESLLFTEGQVALQSGDGGSARALFEKYLEGRPSDPAGHYNLALALEASDRYLEAAEHLERYLALAPDAPDRAEVEREISLLPEDHLDHRAHQVEVLRSDLEYLETYYQSLFRRTNTDLAVEFAGFLREKQEFYAHLPDRIGVEEPWLERATEDLAAGFERIGERLGTPTFDRDAVSLLAVPISRLEDVVERLEERW